MLHEDECKRWSDNYQAKKSEDYQSSPEARGKHGIVSPPWPLVETNPADIFLSYF